MSLRDQVALAYDDEHGLRCLPRSVKPLFRKLLKRLPDDCLPSLAERLRRVEQYIEPLCVATLQGGTGPLQTACLHLDRANSVNQLADLFGVELPENSDESIWLHWGFELQRCKPFCLIAIGLWWAQPIPIEQYTADDHSIGFSLAADVLLMLVEASQAVGLLETFSNLDPDDFTDAPRLRMALSCADSPLLGLSPYNRAFFFKTLADALALAPHRGPIHAALLLEMFLNLDPDDYADVVRLRTALTQPESPLAGLTANNRALFIRILAGALAFIPRRGHTHAVRLLETFLNVVPDDFGDAARLRTALFHPDSPLAEVYAINRSPYITTLADALSFIPGRGHTQAVLLLETFANLTSDDFGDAARLRTALFHPDSPLAEMDAINRSPFITTLADALRFTPGRGYTQAALLLETFLNLIPDDFCDAARLRTALLHPNSPLAEMAAISRARLIRALAEVLGHLPGRGNTQAALLQETFLNLVPEDFADAAHLRTVLSRPDSPLAGLPADNRASFIQILAVTLQVVPGRGSAHAARLLEAFLNLVPEDFSNASHLRAVLSRPDAPVAGLTANNRASCIRALAEALGCVPGRVSDAVLLLEAFADNAISSFAAGDICNELVPRNRLNLVATWLQYAPTLGRSVESTCAAAVRFIRTLRNERLGSQFAVEEFFLHARGLWYTIRGVTLAAIESAPAVERPRLEQQLLYWAEQFENRLLFERLLSQGMPAGDGATALTNWEPGRWGLHSPWDELAVRNRVSRRYPGRRNEIPVLERGCAEFMSPTACCLRQQPIPLQPGGVPVGSTGSHGRAAERSLPELPEWQLHDLLPTSAVWIRAYFDDDDRLRWSAWRSTGNELVRLAGGASAQPQARQRLTLANLAFDLAVERVWLQATADPRLNKRTLAPLLLLGQEVHQRCLLGTPIDSLLTEALHDALRELWKAGHSTLASLGSTLLNDDDSTDVAAKLELLQLWQTELQALQAWNRSGKKAGQDDERRAALDAASHEHLAALQAELDLAPLWDATGPDFRWSDTDLLLQLAGPALAMPAAWLDLGGEPLFRRVASTSSVVSLTFRHLAAEEAAKQPAIDPHLLSAHWEEPTDRHKAIGLAYLHHRLHALPRGSATASKPASFWNIWSLGDDPQLHIDHLQRALGGTQRFGVVVLGGHGSALKAGIQLADGHANPDAPRVVWCGEGANLHGVDLLVLVSCAVGRLNQQGDRDVEGMYVQLAGQGARCVVAARWPISDLEAAELTAEFVERYIRGLGAELRPGPFARARAFNAARRELLDHVDPTRRVTFHQAAAFELYGLG